MVSTLLRWRETSLRGKRKRCLSAFQCTLSFPSDGLPSLGIGRESVFPGRQRGKTAWKDPGQICNAISNLIEGSVNKNKTQRRASLILRPKLKPGPQREFGGHCLRSDEQSTSQPCLWCRPREWRVFLACICKPVYRQCLQLLRRCSVGRGVKGEHVSPLPRLCLWSATGWSNNVVALFGYPVCIGVGLGDETASSHAKPM